MKNMKRRAQRPLITHIAVLLVITALAFPSHAAEAKSITVPSGQKEFVADLYVDEAVPYAGVEFGLTLSDENCVRLVSFQQGEAIRGAASSPFITARGTHYFGFYKTSNAYSGRLKVGTLHFTYAGDAVQKIILTEMTVYRVGSDNTSTGTKKESPVMEITVTRAAPGGKPSGPNEQSGQNGQSSGNNNQPTDSGNRPSQPGDQTTIKSSGGNEKEKSSKSEHFSDVGKKWGWAAKEIDYLYEIGVTKGTGNGKFSPEAGISRGDFSLMLVRAFDLKADTKGNFADVPENSRNYDAIAIVKALGIAYGDGIHFNPGTSVTRQDMFVLLYKTLKILGKPLPEGSRNDLKPFSDSSGISGYAIDSVASLVKAGIIEGSGGRINPREKANRAEMAVVLYKILEYTGKVKS